VTKRQKAAREKLLAAMDECERTRAEAQWCNGYRAHGGDTPEMYRKEQAWWEKYGHAEAKRNRALSNYVAALRDPARGRKP
jgi:hypothetical protein